MNYQDYSRRECNIYVEINSATFQRLDDPFQVLVFCGVCFQGRTGSSGLQLKIIFTINESADLFSHE